MGISSISYIIKFLIYLIATKVGFGGSFHCLVVMNLKVPNFEGDGGVRSKAVVTLFSGNAARIANNLA